MTSTWDIGGRRTTLAWPGGDNFFVTYTYDNDDEMVNVEQQAATSGVGLLAVFTYDNLGHRLGVSRGDGVSTTLTYDAAGRLSSLGYTDASSNQAYSGISYNPADEMVQLTTSNAAYAYVPAALTQTYVTNGLR